MPWTAKHSGGNDSRPFTAPLPSLEDGSAAAGLQPALCGCPVLRQTQGYPTQHWSTIRLMRLVHNNLIFRILTKTNYFCRKYQAKSGKFSINSLASFAGKGLLNK